MESSSRLVQWRSKLPIYIVCPSCGRVTATDTGYCRHCKAPLFPNVLDTPEEVLDYDVFIGRDFEGRRVGLRFCDVLGHVGVFGLTGFGKTTFVKRVLVEVAKRGVKFLVFDYEGEYVNLPVEFTRVDVLKGVGLNPFKPVPPLEDYANWFTGLLASVMMDVYGDSFSPQMMYVLAKSVRKTLMEGGGFLELLENVREECVGLPSGHSTAMALVTRLELFFGGSLKRVWGGDRVNLLGSNVVLDLSRLVRVNPLASRLFVILVLKWIFDRVKPFTKPSLRQVIVVEEAEEIAAKGSGVWSFVRFLLRFRKRGRGLIFVSHSPTLVEEGLLKSITTVVCFRVIEQRDSEILSSLLGLGREGWSRLGSLGVGEALIRVSRVSSPFRVKVEELDLKGLEEYEKKFLASVREKPFIGVRARRKFLGLGSREYVEVEKSLISKGLLKPVTVYLGRGRPVKLYETPDLKGVVHGYGIEYIKRVLREMGVSFKCGGEADIVAGDIVFEVETGSNVFYGKYDGLSEKYRLVTVVPVTLTACKKLRNSPLPSNVKVVFLSNIRKVLFSVSGGR